MEFKPAPLETKGAAPGVGGARFAKTRGNGLRPEGLSYTFLADCGFGGDFMWDIAGEALGTAKLRGATYADVRVMHLRQRDLTTKNGEVGTLAQSESVGIGIRVLAQGGWGFASTDRLTREGVSACAAQAVAIAKASALAGSGWM